MLLSWGSRLKIIDPDSKMDVGDEVVGHVFLAIAAILYLDFQIQYIITINLMLLGLLDPSIASE